MPDLNARTHAYIPKCTHHLRLHLCQSLSIFVNLRETPHRRNFPHYALPCPVLPVGHWPCIALPQRPPSTSNKPNQTKPTQNSTKHFRWELTP